MRGLFKNSFNSCDLAWVYNHQYIHELTRTSKLKYIYTQINAYLWLHALITYLNMSWSSMQNVHLLYFRFHHLHCESGARSWQMQLNTEWTTLLPPGLFEICAQIRKKLHCHQAEIFIESYSLKLACTHPVAYVYEHCYTHLENRKVGGKISHFLSKLLVSLYFILTLFFFLYSFSFFLLCTGLTRQVNWKKYEHINWRSL